MTDLAQHLLETATAINRAVAAQVSPQPEVAPVHQHRTIATISPSRDALEEILDMLDGMEDVEDGEHGPRANLAMRIATVARKGLGK